jgi:hypothetical protein
MITKFKIFENNNNNNNNNTLPNIEFAIDIRNASDAELRQASKEFEKYTNYVKYKDFTSSDKTIPWAWHIEIDNKYGYKRMFYSVIKTPGWGAGVEYMEDIITIKEFLNVGLKGVKDLVKQKKEERILKKDIDKYNL